MQVEIPLFLPLVYWFINNFHDDLLEIYTIVLLWFMRNVTTCKLNDRLNSMMDVTNKTQWNQELSMIMKHVHG